MNFDLGVDFTADGGDELDFESRILSTRETGEDTGEVSLRPKTLDDYIGQEKAKGNLKVYIEAAKKAGVRVAVENMIDFGRRHRRYCAGDVYEMVDLVETINDPSVGLCIDTGHANISGMKAGDALRVAGKHLIATHINDNSSKAGLDQHLLPYFGDVDWPDVMKALSEIGYKGHFTYEIARQNVPDALRPNWLKYTVEVGRQLLAMIEK